MGHSQLDLGSPYTGRAVAIVRADEWFGGMTRALDPDKLEGAVAIGGSETPSNCPRHDLGIESRPEKAASIVMLTARRVGTD